MGSRATVHLARATIHLARATIHLARATVHLARATIHLARATARVAPTIHEAALRAVLYGGNGWTDMVGATLAVALEADGRIG